MYYLSTIEREKKKKKAINNYLIKCISANSVLLLSSNYI